MLELIKNDIKGMETKQINKKVTKGFGVIGQGKQLYMSALAEAIRNEVEKPKITETANGNIAFSTTGTGIVDFFAEAGSIRNWSKKDKQDLFREAYNEDKLIALKMLFYFRDVRGGQGERQLFRDIISELAIYDEKVVRKNLILFAEYGRWDDLFCLLETGLEKDVINLIANQLTKDWADKFPSLLAKWMKSENTSSNESKRIAKILRKGLGMTSKEYRKMLSALRKKIDIVEAKISAGDFDSIDYSVLPSGAMMKYRHAFERRTPDKFRAYTAELVKPVEERSEEFKDIKVNAKTLYPNDIISKFRLQGFQSWTKSKPYSDLTAAEAQLLEAQWDALPDYTGGKSEQSLVMADTSGSMSGQPLDVAISLAMYFAERNNGPFKNMFMSFNSDPEFKIIKGDSLYARALSISDTEWGSSTNINKAFNKLLDLAVRNNVSNEDMVKKVYIVSDMQFNYCVSNYSNEGLTPDLRKRFKASGYDLPQIVFWNVNATEHTFPTSDKDGIAHVSGFSPSIFETLMSGDIISPLDVVLKTVNKDRYSAITI